METKPILVLGATGSFGGAITRELLRRGRPVRAIARDLARARSHFGGNGVDFVSGDVLDRDRLDEVARGCAAIVHAINVPYHQWDPTMIRATENVIAAGRHVETVIFPGNVYGLGSQTGHPLDEETPNRPDSRKGRLRVTLEQRLQAATLGEEIRAVVVRAGDYFGPTVRHGLVDPIFGNAARGKSIRYLGNGDALHQWVYVPDVASAAADLLDIAASLEPFEIVNVGGYTDRQRAFLRTVASVAGRPNLAVRRTPWSMLRLVALFNPVVRELFELRYLFDDSVVLDDAKLRRLVPSFDYTPVEEAIRETLESYRSGS
ncbi:MAG: NAD-dependent epimerase/dehydratase family protein [Thermoanaerobaculia bacterium]